MNNFKNSAFTLAEATITLVLLSILISVTIPAVTNIAPSNTKVGFRNAYNITSKIISDLINNETLYPKNELISTDRPIPKYFFYTEIGTLSQGTEDDTFSETNDLKRAYDAQLNECECTNGGKLVQLFCCGLNASSASCTSSECIATTNNGMKWTITQKTITIDQKDKEPYMTIFVDVNGDKGPVGGTAKNPDKFTINVFYNGRIEVPSEIARTYLNTPFDSRKKE